MAETNTTSKGFENVKNIKAGVINAARDLQKRLTEARQHANTLALTIRARQAEFQKDLVVEEPAVADVVAPAAPAAPAADNIEVVAAEPAAPAAEVAEAPAQPAAPVKSEPAAKPAATKPAEVKPQPATKVVTTVENGREVKTYTDEKGNVRVRKFLEPPTKRPAPAAAGRPDARNPQGRPARPQQGARPNAGFAGKDKDAPTSSQHGPKAQPKRSGGFAPVDLPRSEPQKNYGNKNKTKDHPDEKREKSKKALLTRDYTADYDEDRIVRRARTKKSDSSRQVVVQKITNAVVDTKNVPIKVLSEKIGVPVSEIISQLFKEGIMKTINDSVDFDYAEYIASLHEVTLELKMDKTAEELISEAEFDDGLVNDTKRPPIVTVMGHVDHGKTSLLDAIRKTHVTSGEAGGITQHIGAYTVKLNGEQITFIDTPGHEAFTAMRARGAKITDVAIIVVAADDGVMPQTIEAINHAKAAEVSIIVAINKMDKPHVDPERVKQQLTEYGLLAEEWGGDTIMVPVSAKTGMGLDTLLESVLLVTEIKELKANPKKLAVGTVLEAKLDPHRGPVATILVANGTLKIGDWLVAGKTTCKIRAMFDDKGRKIKSAGPSMPAEVLGFTEVPAAGDRINVGEEKLVKKVAEERANMEEVHNAPAVNFNDLFGRIAEGKLKNLNLVVKTDVQGSLEALTASLEKLSNDEVTVKCVHKGVGGINESDVMLAQSSDAVIIGFNVRADSKAREAMERTGVDVHFYNVIYDAVDDVTAAMKGMLAPKFKETVVGSVEVRNVFKITGVGSVAGGYVLNGKAIRNGKVRIFRDNVAIYDGNILALKRFKDDVKEVASGYECGISVENYNDIKIGDVFEIYQMEQVAQ